MNIPRTFLIIAALLAVAAPFAFGGLSGPAPIPNPPGWSLTPLATTLCSGQVNYIPINVTNKGGPQMEDIQLSIVSTKDLYPAGNGTANVGNLNSSDSRIAYLPVFVSANVSSFISTGIGLSYYYYFNTYQDTEVRNATFTAEKCAQQLSVGVSRQIVTAGMIENMTINITNSGPTAVNSILVKFLLPSQQGTWLSNQPLQIASIPPKTTIRVNQSVYISRNASLSVPLNITASYYNGTTLNQVFDSIPLLTSGVINLTTSSFTVSPSEPAAGSIFSISFVLTDVGTSGATDLTVAPLPPKGFTTFGSNSVFVGSISTDSQTPVTVSLVSNALLKSGTYTIPIRVNYLNGLRQNLTTFVNESITLAPASFNATKFVSRTGAHGSASSLIFDALLAVIIIALLFLYIKERKKRGHGK
jgi:hypothetical protein